MNVHLELRRIIIGRVIMQMTELGWEGWRWYSSRGFQEEHIFFKKFTYLRHKPSQILVAMSTISCVYSFANSYKYQCDSFQ